MLCAQADFCEPGSHEIKGFITFTQTNEKFVRVDIELTDVPIGIHGMHVHEKPLRRLKDLVDKNCCDILGGHFNGPIKIWTPKTPGGTPHGSWSHDTERHLGDMCNNIMSLNGTVRMTYNDYLISLILDEPNCILGRSVVIHEDEDDEGLYFPKRNKQSKKIHKESKITGNAGKRIACANIEFLGHFKR
jgi:Cu-Zn family superoxide dismutase